jgi:hypothetical protein
VQLARRWPQRPGGDGAGRHGGLFPVAAGVAAAALVCAGCASSPSTVTVVAVPTLGRPAGIFAHGEGFGQVRPSRIFNGGDPTGLVSHLTWKSWGGTRAYGTGTSDYVGPSQTVATGTQERVTVVAFDRGTCHGKLMYQAVEWYFPQHGQKFDSRRYENICTGSYVPATP